MPALQRPPAAPPRGLSLIETLVALLVLALGSLSLMRQQVGLHLGTDLARQRTEAARLAQQDMEAARAFVQRAASGAAPGGPTFDAIGDQSTEAPLAAGANATYRVERHVAVEADGAYKTVTTQVHWLDRSGRPQVLRLDSVVAGVEPALGALLLAGAARGTPLAPHGRQVAIPAGAQALGDGRSVLRPEPAAALAWVIDNASGQVTQRCSLPAGARGAALTPADLVGCIATQGLIVAGYVSFAGTGARPLDLVLSGSDGGPAPDHQCADDADAAAAAGRTVVAYHCAVFAPARPARWSGRLDIRPQGWALGTAAGQYTVCRYSRDADGDGRIGNHEHPQTYLDVEHSLSQQNFLVIEAPRRCPGDATAPSAPHQP